MYFSFIWKEFQTYRRFAWMVVYTFYLYSLSVVVAPRLLYLCVCGHAYALFAVSIFLFLYDILFFKPFDYIIDHGHFPLDPSMYISWEQKYSLT